VNFRNNPNRDKFITAIKNIDNGSGDLADAVALLPKDVQNQLSDWTVSDLRYVYGALSRVSHTRDKWSDISYDILLDQVDNDSLQRQFTNIIDAVLAGNTLADDQIAFLKDKTDGTTMMYHTNTSPESRLAYALMPFGEMAAARTGRYEKKLESESGYSVFGHVLTDIRNDAIINMKGAVQAEPTPIM
jgi:hypothetical protein